MRSMFFLHLHTPVNSFVLIDRYEQLFVYHLLLHLKCNEVDPHYKPTHGLGAIPETRPPRTSKSRERRR
jgi:hypothetical protein